MNPNREVVITDADGICVRVTSTSSSTSVTPRDATLKKRRQNVATTDFGRVCSSSTIELSHVPSTINSRGYWSTARPWFIFKSKRRTLALFLSIDFLIYLDRGIVPGAHDEFTRFLMKSHWIRQNPELYFGLLQSVFIGGLAISAPVLSYMAAASQYPTKYLSLGLVVWILSIAGCGLAGMCNSILLLFLFRALSGVGEGAFIGLVAPMLMDTCNADNRGVFLGIFYGLMPTGVALGFIGSAAVVSFTHWSASFIILALLASCPIIAIVAFATTRAGLGVSPLKHFAENVTHLEAITPVTSIANCDNVVHLESLSETPPALEQPVSLITIDASVDGSPTFGMIVRKFLPSLIFLSLLTSGAAQTAVTASLSAFGTAYLLNLGLFTSEFFASTTIGIAGALTGTIGTVAGGVLLRFPLRFHKNKIDGLANRIHGKSNWHGEDEHQFFDRLLIIKFVSLPLMGLSCIAAILTSAAPIMLFMGGADYLCFASLGIGLALLAMTQSGLNLNIMMTAPERFRSLAISLFTLGLHIFGDVPGPIIVGYLKDRFAPHCKPGHPLIEGPECAKEKRQLVLTLIIFLSWTHFVWIGLALSYWRSSKILNAMMT